MRDTLSWRLAGFKSCGRHLPAGGATETARIVPSLGHAKFALPVSVPSDYTRVTFRRAVVHSWFGDHHFGSAVSFSHGGDFERLIHLRGERGGSEVNYYRF